VSIARRFGNNIQITITDSEVEIRAMLHRLLLTSHVPFILYLRYIYVLQRHEIANTCVNPGMLASLCQGTKHMLNILALSFGLSGSIKAATIIFVLEQGCIKTRVSSFAAHLSHQRCGKSWFSQFPSCDQPKG
jgi:hypothetical protein